MRFILKIFSALSVFFLLSFIGGGNIALAQTPSVTCSVSSNPANAGSRVNITVTLNNCQLKGNNLTTPKIPGLKYIGGPGYRAQETTRNGVATSTVSFIYTYQVVAKSDIKIPPIKLATSRGVLASDPFILKVVKPGSANNNKGYGNFACVIETNKKTVHLGEPIIIQYKIYSKYNSVQYRESIPELEGFWKEEIESSRNSRSVRQINGVDYIETIVKEVLAFPQQTGEFTIEGYDLYGVISLSVFNKREINTSSNSVNIKVVPLPEGKPSEFMGTFSDLEVKAQIDVDSVEVNEAFNFEITYSGKGNLKLIREPELEWPTEFEVFDPELIDRININQSGESGRRTYKYTIIPRAEGTYDLPEVTGNYFNQNRDKYISQSSSNGSIVVKRDPNSASGSNIYSPKSGVQVLNHDIRHIKSSHGHWVAINEHKLGTTLIWLLYLLGPVIGAFALISRRMTDAEAMDIVGTKHKKALKNFLSSTKNCCDYTQLGDALETYLCSKLGCGRSEFSRSKAINLLKDQIEESELKVWDDLLKQCEMARFANTSSEDIVNSAEKAQYLAKKSDSKIKLKRMMIIVGAILMSPFVIAQTEQFEFANNAYIEGDFELAAATYEEISKEHNCFELEYNLGNCYYKLEEVGKTILHYERAKLIDPLNDDLRANILLADLRVIDKIEPLPGVGIDKMLGVLFAGKKFGLWLILSLSTWTFGFILIAIRLKRPNSLLHPFTKSGATILISASLLFTFFLYSTHQRISHSAWAVIMEDKVDVMSNPSNSGIKLFHLHEGSRGCIQSEEGDWVEIRLDNGNVGWLPKEAIERI